MTSLETFISGHIRQDGEPQTHTLFPDTNHGGRTLYIPPQDREQFLRLYIEYVKKVGDKVGGANALVEWLGKDTDQFPFFLDVDFDVSWFQSGLIDRRLVEEGLDEMYRFTRLLLGQVFQIEPQIVVSRRTFYKVHVNVPNIIVTKQQARQIIGTLQCHLNAKFPDKRFVDGDRHRCMWVKVLDKSVYSSGLRMLYSHKGNVTKSDERDKHVAVFGNEEPFLHTYALLDEHQQRRPPSLEDLCLTTVHCSAGTQAAEFVNETLLTAPAEVKRLEAAVKITAGSSETIAAATKRAVARSNSRDEDSAQLNASFDRLVIGDGEAESQPIDVTTDVHTEINRLIGDAFSAVGYHNPPQPDGTIKALASGNAYSVQLTVSPCPFAKRFHNRSTGTNPRSPLYVIVTKNDMKLRCRARACQGMEHGMGSISDALAHSLFGITQSERLMDKCLMSQTNEHVTEFIMTVIQDDYAASPMSATQYQWYHYSAYQHRWTRVDRVTRAIMRDDGSVQRQLDSYVRSLIARAKATEAPKAGDDDTASEAEKFTALITRKWNTLRDNLQNLAQVETLKRLLGLKLHLRIHDRFNASFSEIIDKNPKLLGFTNGVFDFGRKEFRAGKPDDYISKTTGIQYLDFDTQVPADHKQGLIESLGKIFPREDEYHFLLKEIASCLDGSPVTQRFFMLIGTGANGKSTLVRLINLAFGDYAGEADITMFTKPRGKSSEASEDLMALRGKRFVVCSESNAKDVLQLGFLKWISGGDRITGREIYGKQTAFYLQATFFMLANEIPAIHANQNDYGTFRRLKPRELRNTFVPNPDPNKPNELPIDPDIDAKAETWKEAFMSLLVWYHLSAFEPEYPESFRQQEALLRSNNNHYVRFYTQHISTDTTSLVPCVNIFDAFRKWVRDHGFHRAVNFDEFVRQITLLLGDRAEIHVDEDGSKCWQVKLVNCVKF